MLIVFEFLIIEFILLEKITYPLIILSQTKNTLKGQNLEFNNEDRRYFSKLYSFEKQYIFKTSILDFR